MSNLCIGTATPTKLRVLPNTKSDLCTASSQLPRSSESCQTPCQTCAQRHRNSHEAQSLAKHQVKLVHRHRNSHEAQSLARRHVKPVHRHRATPTKLGVLPSNALQLLLHK